MALPLVLVVEKVLDVLLVTVFLATVVVAAVVVAPFDPDSFPIALRNGKRTCTAHPITQFVLYTDLSPLFRAFVSSVSTTSIPKFIS